MGILKLIYPGLTINRRAPVNLKQGDELFFGGSSFQSSLPASFLNYFQHVIVSDIGVIIKNFRLQKKLIVCYDEDFKKYAFRYLAKVLLRTKRIKSDKTKTYLLIFDNYSGPNGFFHWISDGLSKLIELKNELENYTLIVPEYFKNENIYIETLAFFNIKKLFYIKPDTSLKVEKLLVSDLIAPTGNFHPVNAIKLRDFMWQNCIDKNEIISGNNRIYISRRNASRRFLINEKDVESLLKEYNFQIINMEDYSFREQINIAYNARILVSIHGGALTHIHFMQPESSVLEFRKENDSKNNCYFSLADAMKVNYYYQFCECHEISDVANNFDLTADLNELRKNIELMIEKS